MSMLEIVTVSDNRLNLIVASVRLNQKFRDIYKICIGYIIVIVFLSCNFIRYLNYVKLRSVPIYKNFFE